METRRDRNMLDEPQANSTLNGAQPGRATNWTRLNIPEARDWHSKETAKLRTDLEKRAAKLHEARQAEDEMRAKLNESPVESVDSNAIFQTDIPQVNLFNILQTELQIRMDLVELFSLQQRDRYAAISQANKDLEAAQEDVKEKLLAMGYLPPNNHSPTPGAIVPLFILGHPSVLTARARAEDLRQDWSGLIKLNDQAIQTAKQRMQRLKQRALAG